MIRLLCSLCRFRLCLEPSTITLRDALYQVGEGLVYSQIGRDEALVKAGAQPRDFGLYPAEVIVTFNVTAGSSISAEGGASGPPTLGSPTLKLAGAWTGNRGNTITIKYQSVYYRLPGQVGADLPDSSTSSGSSGSGSSKPSTSGKTAKTPGSTSNSSGGGDDNRVLRPPGNVRTFR